MDDAGARVESSTGSTELRAVDWVARASLGQHPGAVTADDYGGGELERGILCTLKRFTNILIGIRISFRVGRGAFGISISFGPGSQTSKSYHCAKLEQWY